MHKIRAMLGAVLATVVLSTGFAVAQTAPAQATDQETVTYSAVVPMSGAQTKALLGTAAINTAATTWPGGWNDVGYTVYTEETTARRSTVAVQVYRSSASTDPFNTITAAQARCAVRKLGATTGVQIDSCRFGITGGAGLRSDGPFYDGGTCCANGLSGFRYVSAPQGPWGLVGRMIFSYRPQAGAPLVTGLDQFSNSTDHVFNLS